MSFHLIESSILKVTKVKLSSLVWKIRHFKGQFLMLASPIAKLFPQFTPFFIATGLPKKSKPTLLNKTKSYNYQFNCLRTWTALSTEWIIACMQTAQSKLTTVRKHIKLYNNPTPWNLTRLPQTHTRWFPCVCATTWHPARHKPPSIWGRHWALKDRGKSWYKNTANPHSRHKA